MIVGAVTSYLAVRAVSRVQLYRQPSQIATDNECSYMLERLAAHRISTDVYMHDPVAVLDRFASVKNNLVQV